MLNLVCFVTRILLLHEELAAAGAQVESGAAGVVDVIAFVLSRLLDASVGGGD